MKERAFNPCALRASLQRIYRSFKGFVYTFALKMASAITGDSQGEEELILFVSDSKTSNFEGFDIDTMPLSFHARRIEDHE